MTPLMNTFRRRLLASGCAVALAHLAGCVARPVWKGDDGTAYGLLNRSTIALIAMTDPARRPDVASALHDARAVFIFPDATAMGLVAGDAARSGLVLVRDPAGGGWTGPAFCALDGGGRWLEASFKGKGLLIVVLSDEHVPRLFDGGSAIDAKASRPSVDLDILVFSQAPGTVAGSLVGAGSIHARDALNDAYYGQPASPEEILHKRVAGNPSAAELQDVLARASR